MEAVDQLIKHFQELTDRVSAFEQNKDRLILDLVRDNEAMVIAMNVDDQLFQGITADNQETTPSYRPSTIQRKKRKSQPYDRVTLRDEGDFHSSFFVRYGTDEFTIDAADYKKQWLDRKYTPKIYGLTPDNIDRLTAMIRDRFVEEAKRQILGQ